MALASAIEGATRPAQSITWYRGDGVTPEDLAGATITGRLRYAVDGTSRDIAGTLTVTDGAAGEFTWAYDADDVAQPGAVHGHLQRGAYGGQDAEDGVESA